VFVKKIRSGGTKFNSFLSLLSLLSLGVERQRSLTADWIQKAFLARTQVRF
jgi:hypothetical protein